MDSSAQETIAQLIRRAREDQGLSQTRLAKELATLSGRHTINRDLISHWERGAQIPRAETRQWLAVFFGIPQEQFEQAAALSKRRTKTGNAVVAHNAPTKPGLARRAQGTPELLPVLRSRVQAGILAAVLLNPDRWFSLSELAETAGAALASVDKEVRLLETSGIVSGRTEGTMRLYHASRVGPGLAPLIDLVRLTYGVPQVIGEEFGSVEGVGRLVLSGMWAERFAGIPGAAPESLELIVVSGERVDPDELRLAGDRAEQRLGRPVRWHLRPTDDRNTTTTPTHWGRRPVVEVRLVRPADSARARGEAPVGHDAITHLLDSGQLTMTNGPDAQAEPSLELAEQHLGAAEQIVAEAPQSVHLLLAEAAQLIATGLLAHQGLRVAPAAHPNTAGEAVTAQFGHQYSHVVQLRERSGALRLRANRLTPEEAQITTATLRALLTDARSRIRQLPLFTPRPTSDN
ncbi:helix-turn-helix transcriptional regulator [Kribbella sp.]|uniref:helix-turn-helix domain-containing protein n=1 Tax=Kribbella sp. TaxID=1871183 RepID=UPI002D2375EA|nr:helix-turn-helix transcriptional regulator [Kribbella sp.]HZX08246.1 helix-turn-helix transcriptional regulator [Kribbella sp.]